MESEVKILADIRWCLIVRDTWHILRWMEIAPMRCPLSYDFEIGSFESLYNYYVAFRAYNSGLYRVHSSFLIHQHLGTYRISIILSGSGLHTASANLTTNFGLPLVCLTFFFGLAMVGSLGRVLSICCYSARLQQCSLCNSIQLLGWEENYCTKTISQIRESLGSAWRARLFTFANNFIVCMGIWIFSENWMT